MRRADPYRVVLIDVVGEAPIVMAKPEGAPVVVKQ